jgi:hypothetical protein
LWLRCKNPLWENVAVVVEIAVAMALRKLKFLFGTMRLVLLKIELWYAIAEPQNPLYCDCAITIVTLLLQPHWLTIVL